MHFILTYKENLVTIPRKYVENNIDRLFIAYSYVYIRGAIAALKKVPDAEAVVIQPYETKKSFTSTIEALELYRQLIDENGIPILFTPQGRRSGEGQFFEYSSRLLEVLDMTKEGIREEIEQKIRSKKWVLQDSDKLYAKKNVLIAKSPIVSLSKISSTAKLPISEALNILRQKRGEPVQAVAIPAPKLIRVKHKKILNCLQK